MVQYTEKVDKISKNKILRENVLKKPTFLEDETKAEEATKHIYDSRQSKKSQTLK